MSESENRTACTFTWTQHKPWELDLKISKDILGVGNCFDEPNILHVEGFWGSILFVSSLAAPLHRSSLSMVMTQVVIDDDLMEYEIAPLCIDSGAPKQTESARSMFIHDAPRPSPGVFCLTTAPPVSKMAQPVESLDQNDCFPNFIYI